MYIARINNTKINNTLLQAIATPHVESCGDWVSVWVVSVWVCVCGCGCCCESVGYMPNIYQMTSTVLYGAH